MATEEKNQPPNQARKKWRRLLVWLGIPALLLLAINGPVARWLVLSTLDKQLQAQGMQGQAQISGWLVSGFTLRQISYSGTQGIRSLEIKRLSVDYRILELFDSKLRKIAIDQGAAVIDIARFPESPGTGTASKQRLTETLRQIQAWLGQPAIEATQLEITLLQQDEQQAHITIDALNHSANSADFALRGIGIRDRTGRSTPTQDMLVVWEKEHLTLDRIELLPDIIFNHVALDWTNNLRGHARLAFLQASLDLNIDDAIELKLSAGSINSEALAHRFELDMPGSFVLSGMNARIKDWQKKPTGWDIEGSLQLHAASYDGYQLSDSTLRLKQQDRQYSLQLDGQLDSSPVSINVAGSWSEPEDATAWASTQLDYRINTPRLGSLGKLWKDRPVGVNLTSTSVQLAGSAKIEGGQLIRLTSKGGIQGITADNVSLPPLTFLAEYQHQGPAVVAIQSTAKSTGQRVPAIDLHARFDRLDQSYRARLSLAEPDPQWINALARVLDAGVILHGPARLTWSGSGSTSDWADPKQRHEGNLEIEQLELKLPQYPALQVSSQLSYAWPKHIHLKSLALDEGNWHAAAAMQWDGKRIEAISARLTRGKELVASLNGTMPYSVGIRDTRGLLEQTEPWSLSIKSEPTALAKLGEWFGIDLPAPLTGKTRMSVKLSGTPKKPEIKGGVRITELKGLDDQQLSPLNAAVDFYSKDQKLIFTGILAEGKDQRLTARGSVPFTPSTWVKDPHWISRFASSAPVDAEININQLPLARLDKLIPGSKKITGAVSGNARISGTLEKPVYALNLDADVPLIKITASDIGDIRDIKLSIRLDQTEKATVQLTAQINGGKFEVSGDVDLNDFPNPLFNLTVNTRYALVHRDDLVSVRAHTDLQIKGTLDDATISGTVGIVESLFYKDIELIPIGVPSSAVATVRLPGLSDARAEEGLPIPAPFSNWKLDLTVRTDDPVLIRGNVATGNLTGSLKVGGTLAKPLPRGTILANRVKARLPFSILNIEQGQIIFNGRDGLNPSLKIRGKSTVGAYDVNVFVYGPASSPKTTFNSFPPLPESEIMALLATGTTTSSLENRSVATFKAFQLFLVKLKQRSDKPGGNRLFKTLLTGVEDLNLKVGETDPFTGRKFASATVEIHPRWHLTAQVDDTQQTRGLIIYVLRFR